ncbi:MAG TPA: RHS repeat-associated core domain-containing protein [Thermoanaerobaculia bacterium]|nr:RHS repeat-associated core domain-containing protein [Thermoanaerobaculia bacterium]
MTTIEHLPMHDRESSLLRGRNAGNGENTVTNHRSDANRLLRRSVIAVAISFWSVTVHAQAVNTTTKQLGRLTSSGNGLTRTYFQYDPRGRTTATQIVQDGQSRVFRTRYGYPQNPAVAEGPGTVAVAQVLPDGDEVTYAHDAMGRQVTIKSTLGSATDEVLRDLRLNARGQVTKVVLGNGTTTQTTYNEAGDLRLASTVTTNAAGQKIQEYRYTYDANGNVTGTSDGVRPDQSATYGYDELGQLTVINNSSGNAIESYSYDKIGNLTQKGALAQTYGAGGRPHALASSGGIPYSYDGNGNVVAIGTTTTLQWNGENMPVTVAAGAVNIQRSYIGHALWKKVEQGKTTYYLPSMHVENGVATKYYGTLAERTEQAGNRGLRFYHADHLGSSSVMTDQSGNVIRRASYLPWGQDRGVVGTFVPKLQFNFKEKDAAGFYDYGARLYHPTTGRWLSADPLLLDGPNRYAYVRNNPLTFTDPTGLAVDDYFINRDGSIYRVLTDDTFDRFYVETEDENLSGGYTLAAQIERNEDGLTLFPATGNGFGRHQTSERGGESKITLKNGRVVVETVGSGDHYLKPATAAALFGVIHFLNANYLSFGDMSSSNGSDPWQTGMDHHGGHGHFGKRSGLDIDYRYLDADGNARQGVMTDSWFHRGNNQALYDKAALFGFNNNYSGFSVDPFGNARQLGGHDNHGHLGHSGDVTRTMTREQGRGFYPFIVR